MSKKMNCIIGCLSMFVFNSAFATSIVVYPTTKRFLGNVSALDRDKYINFHVLELKKDADFEKVKKMYNFNPDYIGSRSFNSPIKSVKNGKIPNVKQKYTGVRDVTRFVSSGTEKKLFFDNHADYAKINIDGYIKDLATYTANVLKSEYDVVPYYIEPLNEPMVHLSKYKNGIKDKNEQKAHMEAMVANVCKYHREIGKAVHATPELKNVKVMGYASAFPEFESGNFSVWKNRYKTFIDIAGQDMDALSFHLYDGSGVNNKGGRRSGSNIEAIMDIIQTYSYIKLDKVLPLAITEYGRLVPNQPGYVEGKKGVINYNPVTNSQAVRSQLHMVLAFMERQNELVCAIPFSTPKQPRTSQYSRASLWIQQNDGHYELSERRYFFEMLKDLKGDRVKLDNDNVDVQSMAFVDGKNLFVVLNNLNDETQNVDLSVKGLSDIKNVEVKTLKIFNDKTPQLDVNNMKVAPKSIKLEYGETAVIKYTLKNKIKFNSKAEQIKYFSKDYLKDIKPNQVVKFDFQGVKSGNGNAILRLSVGREHGKLIIPSALLINGKKVEITKDVIPGYDQNNRKMFFGTMEIPFDISILKNGSNSVEVSYSDNGGQISSAILQLQLNKSL